MRVGSDAAPDQMRRPISSVDVTRRTCQGHEAYDRLGNLMHDVVRAKAIDHLHLIQLSAERVGLGLDTECYTDSCCLVGMQHVPSSSDTRKSLRI